MHNAAEEVVAAVLVVGHRSQGCIMECRMRQRSWPMLVWYLGHNASILESSL